MSYVKSIVLEVFSFINLYSKTENLGQIYFSFYEVTLEQLLSSKINKKFFAV